MLKTKILAAVAGVGLLGSALAQDYVPVANWPTLPAGRDSDGNYLETFGGKAAPYEFNILHKIA
jgi:hypothetical protein